MTSEPSTCWYADPDYWREMRHLAWGESLIEHSASQVELIVRLLGMRKGDTVLDLACGFGRHTLELCRTGLDVTGVDLNQAFIEEARKTAGAEENGSIRYLVADMREFRKPDAFDHIVILYNSFGYFRDPEDDRRVVRNCFDSLRPGGRLLISVTGQEILRHYQVTRRRRGWHERDGVIILEEYEMNEDWDWQQITWTLLEGENRRTIEYAMRVYSEAAMRELLMGEGLVGIEIFGSLSGDPYDCESRKLVMVARKPS